MNRKFTSILIIIAVSFSAVWVMVQISRATETMIYIRSDGSVEGTDKIVSPDNVTYVLTGSISNCSLEVQRDNIVFDGSGYALQGPNADGFTGIKLANRNNVTIENVTVAEYRFCIWLYYSSNITITRCSIIGTYGSYTFNYDGIHLEFASNNTIENSYLIRNGWQAIWINQYSNYNNIIGNNMTQNDRHQMRINGNYTRVIGNTFTKNYYESIYVYPGSAYNVFSDNYIASEYLDANGIELDASVFNTISGNNITLNTYGIMLFNNASDNDIYNNTITANKCAVWTFQSNGSRIYHNLFINNTNQTLIQESVNVWDDGYPSGGNYWSDFKTRYPSVNDVKSGQYQNVPGSDGIWDAPYVIDSNNKDNYPIVPEFPSLLILPIFMMVTLLAVLIYRKKHSVDSVSG